MRTAKATTSQTFFEKCLSHITRLSGPISSYVNVQFSQQILRDLLHCRDLQVSNVRVKFSYLDLSYFNDVEVPTRGHTYSTIKKKVLTYADQSLLSPIEFFSGSIISPMCVFLRIEPRYSSHANCSMENGVDSELHRFLFQRFIESVNEGDSLTLKKIQAHSPIYSYETIYTYLD